MSDLKVVLLSEKSGVSCVLSRRMYYYVNTDQENTNITVAMTVRNKWLGTLPLLGHLEYFKVRNFLRTPLLLFKRHDMESSNFVPVAVDGFADTIFFEVFHFLQ